MYCALFALFVRAHCGGTDEQASCDERLGRIIGAVAGDVLSMEEVMLSRPFARFIKSQFITIAVLVVLAIAQNTSLGQPAPPIRSATAQSTVFIQHIVIIMQENRSFDHYFGTYPGANGIPRDTNGVPKVCVPDPLTGICMRPYLRWPPHRSILSN